jgi:predicted DCC family thiol-disulfide oxidoreductase YuxK
VTTGKIVFFDGVCGLCNWWVDVLIRIDRKNRLKFAPQQGSTFQSPQIQTLIFKKTSESLFYLKNGRMFSKSHAVLHILVDMGGPWKFFAVFFLIPERLLNLIYDLVAKNRYSWFGKFHSCRIPNEQERAKFLD